VRWRVAPRHWTLTGKVVFNLDLCLSPHDDLQSDVAWRWVLFLLEERRVGAMFFSPPCTDCSFAKFPQTRSYARP